MYFNRPSKSLHIVKQQKMLAEKFLPITLIPSQPNRISFSVAFFFLRTLRCMVNFTLSGISELRNGILQEVSF